MCGIVGYIGPQEATPIVLDGLKRLEYRGYDSAGIATLSQGKVNISRAEGKLINLEKNLQAQPLVSATPVGRPMDDLRKLMPIRTTRAVSWSSTTASSRITSI